MKCYYFILFSSVLLWKIVQSQKGGNEITIQMYPFMVQVEAGGKKVCEGSIISANWILTAAHCLEKTNKNGLSIRYGTVISERGGFTVPVVKAIEHPEHNCTTMTNDVALLQIGRPLSFAHNKQPVELASGGSPPGEGANATLVGWGLDKKDKARYKYLTAVNISIVNNKECIKSNETEEVPEEILCAEKSDGICLSGEGGGPLIVDTKQVGVAASREGCGPLTFASITHTGIRDFIWANAGV